MTSLSRASEPDFDAATLRHAVVVGAGAAGMATAVTAARLGTPVTLVDLADGPGGTVANVLIHTIGGLYDDRQQIINDGIVPELIDRLSQASSLTRPRRIGKTWCLNVSPDVYRGVVAQWLNEEPLIEQVYITRIAQADVSGSRVQAIELSDADGNRWLPLTHLVDTTGTAEVIRLIDASLVYDDEDRAAGGLIFRLRGVRPGAVSFPKGVTLVQQLRAAAQSGALPSSCAHAWIDQGVHADEAYVKLFVPIAGEWRHGSRQSAIQSDAARIQLEVVNFLRQFSDFSRAELVQTGTLGIRDGGRIHGDYCLTEDDVRSGRKFADAACKCCWPIEYWHPSHGLELEYLPPGSHYEIPLRALKVKGLENVWAAGKCLSADHRAQASARVVGQCWAMGQGVGRAISLPRALKAQPSQTSAVVTVN